MVKLSGNTIREAQQLKERGYSDSMIARCLDIPAWTVGFMIRRE